MLLASGLYALWVKSEIGDWSYRVSGLTLLTAAITLWDTVYIERAIVSPKRKKDPDYDQLFSQLSPLGREHTNLNEVMSGAIILIRYREIPSITHS